MATQTSTKRNEHPACTCRMCSRGKRSNSGKHLLNQINKKIRRIYKQNLNGVLNTQFLDADVIVIVSTPYTD